MTGLFNGAALSHIAPLECQSATSKKPLCALFVDLNGLKGINDKFGHAAGSEFIKLAATKLVGHVRKSDWVFRIGGDEFVVLMPNTSKKSALKRSREIASSVAQIRICNIPARASFGLAITGKIRKWRTLINAADKAMYRSKALSKINPQAQEIIVA